MPSVEHANIPELVVTPRLWWHVFHATNGAMNLRVILGASPEPPEAVCTRTMPANDFCELPDARYVTSFDHEPSEEELAPWDIDDDESEDDDVDDEDADES